MEYSKYQRSRNLSWDILIDHKITQLPVKISRICKTLGYKIISYDRGQEIINSLYLQSRQQNSDGFTFKNLIFYNDKCSIGRQRFTVAHELGHCLMHDGSGIYNREMCAQDNPIEQEANIFASRLLAPSCVLWALNVTSEDQIVSLCDISLTAAKFRMERLNILYKRNKFLTSPQERKVYEQFKEYIAQNKL